ncbi:hypothetical protein M3212_12360 [Alkalihalobacillus oceani]|uniref:hypothetical protein n=1 Tax=Halalkalibacter oceani TaxID=1653776 RepID=UPI00203B4357|nr:hypothetical protein [Halalkalibacter oceani]MCM3761579.1 hypothetical protein [Halalkalibacter oceani]
MQIQQYTQAVSQTQERPVQLREGDVYRATIKERKGKDEAVLSIRGREVVARFEGGVPAGERTTIQVVDPAGESIQVKALGNSDRKLPAGEQGSAARQQELTQTLRQLGVSQPTSELRQAAAMLMDKGVPLSREAVADLQRFLQQGKPEQRLQTVQALASKRLDVTSSHLNAVHEALHGRPLNQVLTDLARELDPDFKARPVQREQLDRQQPPAREVRQEVQRMTTVERAAAHIERQLLPSVTSEQARTLSTAIEHARTDAARGQEREGITRLVRALEQIERPVLPSQGERPVQAERPQPSAPSPARTAEVEQVRQAVERAPSVERAAQQIESRLIRSQALSAEQTRDVTRAIEQARADAARSQEREGITRLVRALEQIERPASPSQGERPVQAERPQPSAPSPARTAEVEQVRQAVERAPSVERAAQQIESRLIRSQALSAEQTREVTRAIEQARADAARGQEREGITRLVRALEQIERPASPSSQGERPQSPAAAPARTVEVEQVRQAVERAPSVERAAERLQDFAQKAPLDREGRRTVDRAIAEAKHLDRIAAERILQTLQQSGQANSQQNQSKLIQEMRTTLVREGVTESFRDQLQAVLKQAGSRPESADQLQRAVLQSEQLQAVAKERLLASLARIEQTLPALAGTQPQQQALPLEEAIRQAETTLQREPVLARAIQQAQALLSEQALPPELSRQVNERLEAARAFEEQGRELRARQELASLIEQVKAGSPRAEAVQQTAESNTYVQNEQFQTSVEMASKSIAVTTITEKLAQMTAEFKALQRDVTRQLDVVSRQIEQFRNQAQQQAKPLLETTIKKLDHAILRSEMMQFADMKTERQLMQASSQLHEAKKLLVKGQHQEANRIVKEVTQLVERLNFKPSDTKVKHYTAASEQALRDAQLPGRSMPQQLGEIARGPMQEGSPRAMFEMIRSLGLNRDSELAQQLASARDQQLPDDQRNLKTTLLQLARGEEEGARVQQLANQALNNLTGQQLLSRSDQQGNLQSMFFQLPLLLEEKVQNLQVFVNSRNEGEQVDWENCSLYFLMETPKMGEIGIVVSATERQLSVTLKNDQADFQRKMEPLVEAAVEKLSEIGYSINGIKYAQLSTAEQAEKEDTETRQQPIFTEKGFDFKI